MKNTWNQIEKDFTKAKTLINDKKYEKGLSYLFKSFFNARKIKNKKHLLYARILAFVYYEFHYQINDYKAFNELVSPAFKSFNFALKNEDQKPTKEELEDIEYSYNSLKYSIEMKNESDESYNNIKGLNEITNFSFGDSRVIKFEYKEKEVFLDVLTSEDCLVQFHFINVYEIKINLDDTYNDWIYDFYCYQEYGYDGILCFDIGIYKIKCKEITAKKIR